MQNILLDRYGDARIPNGYKLIDTEVGFLHLATTEGQWFIRGQRLCEWAEVFFTGRNINVQQALSPSRALCEAIPTLSEEQATEISVRLGERFYSLSSVTAHAVAQALFPHHLWELPPSREHAAEWLLWLDQQSPNEIDQCILRVVASNWAQQASGELRQIYETTDTETARRILDSWLGISQDESLTSLGEFPVNVPQSWLERARESWLRHLIQTKGDFVERLLKRPLPLMLREVVGKAASDYFTANPQNLTKELLLALMPCLDQRQRGQLRRLLRPPEPPNIPQNPDEVLKWFKYKYLPYREWQWHTKDQQAQQYILKLAREFAEWYLRFYPRTLLSGNYLSFFRTEALKQHKTRYVTLLILLDGLHLIDAQQFLQALQKETGRLAIHEDDLLFAPVPTVTQFAKEALLRAVPPRDVSKMSPLAEDIPERNSPLERLEAAQAGELLIWRIQEPDHTYHARNTSDSLERDIEGQLTATARKVVDIVEQLSSAISLRIVVTTDHGRLLGSSQRNVPIDPGMQAHGRAAWGPTGKAFPAEGYIIDNNLAYLCADRYGLPVDVVVILNEDAFHTNDGKQGQERFAHGGLFPEEVIVPWIVLIRDPVLKTVIARVTGKGRAGQPGTASVQITNPNEIPVVLRSIRITLGGREPETHEFDKEVPALSELTVPLELASWPSKVDAKCANASVVVGQLYGGHIEASAVVELDSEEMYSRDISLLEELGR